MLIDFVRAYMKKVYSTSYERRKKRFTYESRKDILNSFTEPKNMLEASWVQYQCQMRELNPFIILLQNILAVILLPYYWGKKYADIQGIKDRDFRNALYISDGITSEIIPKSLKDEYDLIECSDYSGEMFLGDFEKKFLSRVIAQYWRSPFFCLKLLVKVGLYAQRIYMHNPEAVIVYAEYSFTSSALTEYCESLGIEHINIQHGEKLFNIRDAFTIFSRYYVWDDFYKGLLAEMRVPQEQIIVERPEFGEDRDSTKSGILYDYIYCLDADDSNNMKQIKRSLEKLEDMGYRVCVRFHPRFSNIKEVQRIFRRDDIQNPYIVSASEALAQTRGLISLNSTMLLQAYYEGKIIVIDDVTDYDAYQRLLDLKYILMYKPHMELSTILGGHKDKCLKDF